jgi:tetratricopeptide (TPR) repeat protein
LESGKVHDLDFAIYLQRKELASSSVPPYCRLEQLRSMEFLVIRRIERSNSSDDDHDFDKFVEWASALAVPDNPRDLSNLAQALFEWCSCNDNDLDLDTEINRARAVLQFTPEYDDARISHCIDLSTLLQRRFKASNDIADLKAAIVHKEEALALTRDNGDDPLERLADLGQAHLEHARYYGRENDFTLAVMYLEQVLSLAGDDDIIAHGNLSVALLERFKRFHEENDVNSAIEHQERVLELTPDESPRRSLRLQNLGCSFQARFEFSGKSNFLDTAIEHKEKALFLAENLGDIPWLAVCHHNIGFSLNARIRCFGRISDIDKAVEHHREANKLSRDNNSAYLHYLGCALLLRFERFGGILDLDDAIVWQQRALALTHPDSRVFAVRSNELGISLHVRFESLGKAEDLDNAIQHFQHALDHDTHNVNDWALWRHNLASALLDQFSCAGDIDILKASIDHSRRALQELVDKRNRPTLQHILSNSLFELHKHGEESSGSIVALSSAIKYEEESLSLTSVDGPVYANRLHHLAILLLARNNCLHAPEDREKALSLFQEVIDSPHAYPRLRLKTSLELASILHSEALQSDPASIKTLTAALKSYRMAIDLLPQVAWIGLDTTSRLHHLETTGEADLLSSAAAACAFTLSELEPIHQQQYLQDALEILEQGRSVIWSEGTRLRNDLKDLSEVDGDLARELGVVARRLDFASFSQAFLSTASDSDNLTSSPPLHEEHLKLAIQWENLIARARSHLPRFLRPMGYTELANSVDNGLVVIVININLHRCDMMILCHGFPLRLVNLPQLTASDVGKLAKGIASVYHTLGLPEEDPTLSMSSFTVCEQEVLQCLYALWDNIGCLVIHILEETGKIDSGPSPAECDCHIWWYLTGKMSFLPIHAARPRPESGVTLDMLDRVVSSYIPTLSALRRVQHRAQAPEFKMLVVGCSYTTLPDWSPLPSVNVEMEQFHSLELKGSSDSFTFLEDSSATADSVIDKLSTCSWAHFSCHGFQDDDFPMESSLVLYDCPLPVSRIAQRNLTNADLAVVSACESGKGSWDHSNEALHLVAGLMFAGFRGVIGTMYSIDEEVGLTFTKTLHANLFATYPANYPNPAKAAYALRKTLLYLRDERKAPMICLIPFIHVGI